MSNKTRLDVLLVEQGLLESRQKAPAVIMAGSVFVDGQRVDKPGTAVPNTAAIQVRGHALPYVSRGGLKLEKAAVDIRPLRQLPHRDVLCAFFHQQLHQRQTQLTFRFSHPTVRTGLFHIHIPLCWLFNDLSDLYSNIDAD